LYFRIAVEEEACTEGALEVVGEAVLVGLEDGGGEDDDLEVMVDDGEEAGPAGIDD
jgi:hypothetical protein